MADKFRVLFLHSHTAISGGERSLLNLWTHMDRGTFTPILIIPGEGRFADEARAIGVEVHTHAMPAVRVLGVMRLLRARGFLARFVREQSIDLIHSYGPRNNILASCVTLRRRVPVIWHERNIPVDGEWDVTRHLVLIPDAVICNSQAVARRFGREGWRMGRIRVILNGVFTDRFRPMAPDTGLRQSIGLPDAPVVGIVTNFSVRRRVEVFIRVAKRIHALREDARFLIVGGDFGDDARPHEALEALIKAAGMRDTIYMAGFQDDVAPYIALCDVCCQVTSNDACSRSVLEYMAMAKPVVAINDGGNTELIENGKSGLLVDPDDEEGFARRVIALLEDAGQRKALGAAARQRATDRFDARRNARETEDLYLELFRRKGRIAYAVRD